MSDISGSRERSFRQRLHNLHITRKQNEDDLQDKERLHSEHQSIDPKFLELKDVPMNLPRASSPEKQINAFSWDTAISLKRQDKEGLVTTQKAVDAEKQPTAISARTTEYKDSGPYFCQACNEAKDDPGYLDRVAALLEPLHCSECQNTHAGVFFSEDQRKKLDSTRICIGHQGCYSICPHLTFSLSDIANWDDNSEDRDGTHLCPATNCLCRKVQIEYQTTGFQDEIRIELEADVPEGPADDFWSRSMAKIEQMHKSFAPMFCPHFQTTPDRMYRSDMWWPTPYLPGTRNLFCSTCSSSIYRNSRADKAERSVTAPIKFTASLQLTRGDGMSHSWIRKLDPDSYGHFTDQGTKYITWCDDRGCATTYELLRCEALRASGTYHVGENDPPANMECFLQSLDDRTFEDIKNLHKWKL